MNEDVQRQRTQENNNKQPKCPKGYVWNSKTGGCEKEQSGQGNDPELKTSKNVEAEDVTEDL
ncbi:MULTISPECIES: hypothetical protein [unclassified Tolypothrix]|uniref:hypothetical protein n=1 Tax=unclassified Tolypothrix TaxID=2649714 RepID=UPI0005EAC1D4|nr:MULTISPECIES: hypothetical protein [unclassified Tolypothrix]BAY95889.1 hypothetical protein NIES3275_79660 [Microchaete diplosiphon NIES-3275]EKE96806.1 hypothetical protein FDUTEX481_06349 [Tolypothrix sp. PCC 7601]MBE9083909.1 hypothetical protein [Tolypothrix sp. LEGE 11397]UYD30975.1 hypothetical protein HGR01_39725 [Tolypothrix sp. PCC 7712]UYD38860.1 hypothetical protein HG267_40780 [Tolypothrix sp. PCC 7601]